MHDTFLSNTSSRRSSAAIALSVNTYGGTAKSTLPG